MLPPTPSLSFQTTATSFGDIIRAAVRSLAEAPWPQNTPQEYRVVEYIRPRCATSGAFTSTFLCQPTWIAENYLRPCHHGPGGVQSFISVRPALELPLDQYEYRRHKCRYALRNNQREPSSGRQDVAGLSMPNLSCAGRHRQYMALTQISPRPTATISTALLTSSTTTWGMWTRYAPNNLLGYTELRS